MPVFCSCLNVCVLVLCLFLFRNLYMCVHEQTMLVSVVPQTESWPWLCIFQSGDARWPTPHSVPYGLIPKGSVPGSLGKPNGKCILIYVLCLFPPTDSCARRSLATAIHIKHAVNFYVHIVHARVHTHILSLSLDTHARAHTHTHTHTHKLSLSLSHAHARIHTHTHIFWNKE